MSGQAVCQQPILKVQTKFSDAFGHAISAQRSRILSLLLLLPVVSHGVLLTIPLWRERKILMDRVDVIVNAVFLVYLCGAILTLTYRRHLARFVLACYSSLLALAIGELGVRIWLPSQLGDLPWPAKMHRYLGVGDQMPGVTSDSDFTVNSLGVRGPEVNLDGVDLRILCVGGSTTECLYVTDKQSWPWRLQDLLAEATQKSVFVGNAGKSGLLTPHHSYLLENYRYIDKFNCVLVLCGFNDMGALVLGSRSFDERQRDADLETLTPTIEHQPYYRRLALLRHLSPYLLPARPHTRLQDPRGDWVKAEREKRRRMLETKPIDGVSPKLSAACAVYRASLKKIISLGRDRGLDVVFITQPTLYRKDLPEELQRLLWMNNAIGAFSVAALEEMANAFNQVMIDVCREEGVDCIDLAAQLPKDTTVFYDDCHFNKAGCEQVARILTDYLASKYAGTRSLPERSPDGPQNSTTETKTIKGKR